MKGWTLDDLESLDRDYYDILVGMFDDYVRTVTKE